MMFKKEHLNNHKVLLSLIVIASHLNPLGKMGNNIRYLGKEEQKLVLNNIQPQGIDLSLLESEMKNFQVNPLNLHFLNGLIDGDGCLSFYFAKSPKGIISARFGFTIAQDVHNLGLLEDVKAFLGFGEIYTVNANYMLFKTAGIKHMSSLLFDIMNLRQLNMLPGSDLYNKLKKSASLCIKGNVKTDFFTCGRDFALPLPLIKRNKFIHSTFILFLLEDKDLSYREK